MTDIYDVPECLTQEVTIITLDKEPGELNETTSVYLLEGESQPNSNYILSLRGANTELKRGDVIAFSDVLTDPRFRILSISDIVVNGEAFTNITYEGTEDSEAIVEATKGFPVYLVKSTKSACVEVPAESSEAKDAEAGGAGGEWAIGSLQFAIGPCIGRTASHYSIATCSNNCLSPLLSGKNRNILNHHNYALRAKRSPHHQTIKKARSAMHFRAL